MSHQILDGLNGTSESGKHCLLQKFSPKSHFCETIGRNKSQLIILVYPIIVTGEELRYDYGFPHAERRRNPQAPGTKSNIDNIEAADSKNKRSRKVDQPFITVTRRKETGNFLQRI